MDIETKGKTEVRMFNARVGMAHTFEGKACITFHETTSGEDTGAEVTVWLSMADVALLASKLRPAIREHIAAARAALDGVTPELEDFALAAPADERVEELRLALGSATLVGYARAAVRRELDGLLAPAPEATAEAAEVAA